VNKCVQEICKIDKIYIIKTIKTKLEKNDNNVYFKLEKKLNYFSNVKFIAISFETHTLFFDRMLTLMSLTYIFIKFLKLILCSKKK